MRQVRLREAHCFSGGCSGSQEAEQRLRKHGFGGTVQDISLPWPLCYERSWPHTWSILFFHRCPYADTGPECQTATESLVEGTLGACLQNRLSSLKTVYLASRICFCSKASESVWAPYKHIYWVGEEKEGVYILPRYLAWPFSPPPPW